MRGVLDDIVRIVPAGDSALLVELPSLLDPVINARVIALAEAIGRRCGRTLLDVVTGYCTLTLYFDALLIDPAWLEAEIRSIAAGIDLDDRSEGALVSVPVCYGGEFGPDLAAVAAFGGCSEEEAVRLHAAETYRVFLVGFVPGFAYMAKVDERIAAPRRATPRTAVPVGSVAVAGGQTGIYPAVTPGGWNIIGRTPLRPYDPARHEPFLFKAGDRVRFLPIDRAEFDRAR
jgi:inhibitor of KinA